MAEHHDASSRPTLAELIDESPIGPLQRRVFLLCAVCLIMDGFDVQALGYVAPSIVQEWGTQSAALGPVFAAGNFGVLIGSILFSTVADRIGRRPVLIIGTFIFAVLTLLAGASRTLDELLLCRLLGGIGLGSIMPQATALIGEFSPRRLRVTLMMTITVGFTAGAAFGGFVAAALIPALGWRSVFYFGGGVPLLVGAAMFKWLPESLQFMALRGERWRGTLTSCLEGLDTGRRVDIDALMAAPAPVPRSSVPLVQLFREGRGVATVLLWIVNFMNLLNLYALASWLPTVVRDSGFDTQTAVLVGTVLQVGGTVGAFGLAWILTRAGFVPTLAATFAIASVSIGLIGYPNLPLAMLFVVVFVAGWCVVGGQPALNALAASYYPTYVRATGLGAALGVGRLGAIVGPVIGAYFLAQQWSVRDIFLAAAVPAFVSLVTVLLLSVVLRRSGAPVSARS